MPPRPIPEDLLPWALSVSGLPPAGDQPELVVVAGDASNRRYFRLTPDGESYIVVEAPPATEKNAEFLAVREMLAEAGICVPGLIGADLDRGFMLLEDLGNRVLLAELTDETVDVAYGRAFDVLGRMAAIAPTDPAWPTYDRALLGEELSRFPEWFVQALLEYTLTPGDLAIWRPFAGS